MSTHIERPIQKLVKEHAPDIEITTLEGHLSGFER
jgi:hypothetical protein